MRKVFVKDTWGISQSVSGFIGTVKAKTVTEARRKMKGLVMYDYGQDTKVWKYYTVI